MAEAGAGPDVRRLVHDLRSPLAVVDGFAALLERDDGSLSAAQRADFAARIRAAATDMRAIVDRAAAGLDSG
jgi:signal transduction histidine kinase